MDNECDCLICPLAKNTQVCNFIIHFKKHNAVSTSYNGVIEEDKRQALINLAFQAIAQWKLKIGEGNGEDNDDYKYFIERLGPHIYKLCFHSK